MHKRLEVLSQTANETVLTNIGSTSPSATDDQDESASDDGEIENDDDHGDEMFEDQPEDDTNDRIASLLKQISLWKMPDPPRQ